ncbi:methyltransferase domain-containing protein, partial [Streptomyces sp. CC77]|uniref:class I SAM-dependent methyltransferase n=1 Tax=Streptomyces sp. CC77 TaxID=1906739 RepID=UPI0034A0FA24
MKGWAATDSVKCAYATLWLSAHLRRSVAHRVWERDGPACSGGASGRLGQPALRPALSHPPFEPDSAVVVVRHLVWALPDPVAALRTWVRLLRPGGRLVLVEGR